MCKGLIFIIFLLFWQHELSATSSKEIKKQKKLLQEIEEKKRKQNYLLKEKLKDLATTKNLVNELRKRREKWLDNVELFEKKVNNLERKKGEGERIFKDYLKESFLLLHPSFEKNFLQDMLIIPSSLYSRIYFKELLFLWNSYIRNINERLDKERKNLSYSKIKTNQYQRIIVNKEVEIKEKERSIERTNRIIKKLTKQYAEIERKLQRLLASLRKEKKTPSPIHYTSKEVWEGLGNKRLIYPVTGKIIRYFGRYKDEALGSYFLNKGLDIQSSPYSSVYAACKGRVIFAQAFSSLNKLVILEHTNSVCTIYGNLSTLNVKEGMVVERSQLLGKLDEEGVLHFELRIKDKAINPLAYMVH